MARIISSSAAGQPAAGYPKRNWPLRPLRLLNQRHVRSLIADDPQGGESPPQLFRTTLGGLRLATRSVRRIHQTPQVPPAFGVGTTSVPPARKRVVKR